MEIDNVELTPMFLGMGNHLAPFSEASNQPEGQEKSFKA